MRTYGGASEAASLIEDFGVEILSPKTLLEEIKWVL